MTEFYDQQSCELNEDYSVIIEDDGKVAYAYLLNEDDIIGDVWLYNQATSPLSVNWVPEDMPFLNPKEFVKEEVIPIVDGSELQLKWSLSNDLTLKEVLIYINNKLIAKLTSGSTPGWSTVVTKDGPLAKYYE